VRKKEGHSGIYLLPNLLTTASLFAAFYSIVASLKAQYDVAAIAIFIGMIADGLDGRIARMTNTQSATIMAVLMVSNIRYYSFKELDFKGKVPFLHVLLIVILFVAIAANPSVVLFVGFTLYALSGPLQTLIALHRMRKQRKKVSDLKKNRR